MSARRRRLPLAIRITILGGVVAVVLLVAPKILNWRTETPAKVHLPNLVPAPTIAAQTALVAAMKAGNATKAQFESAIPLGSPALGMSTILAAMNVRSKEDGQTCYELLGVLPKTTDAIPTAVVVTAGQPPRVVRRWIEKLPSVYGEW